MVKRMTDHEIYRVKLLICEGYSQIDAARAVGVSQSTVNRICAGDIHRHIEWPDLAVGIKLMKGMKDRENDLGAKTLARGLLRVPEVYQEKPPAMEVSAAAEREAIEKAKHDEGVRARVQAELNERIQQVEKEMNDEFLAMATVHERSPDADIDFIPNSIWNAKFMPWAEVLEEAGENEVVQAAADSGDEILMRAVGLVFKAMPKDKWESDEALRLIAGVKEQLEESQPDDK